MSHFTCGKEFHFSLGLCRWIADIFFVLPLQSFPLSPLFVRHTHAQTPVLQPQNLWLLHFLILWPPHLEQSPPRRQALCYSLLLQKQTQDISLLRIFQLSIIVHHPYQSVQCVCVCVCLCVCVCVCASFAKLCLNPWLHYVLAFSFFLYILYIIHFYCS